jgi:hypothetical protein
LNKVYGRITFRQAAELGNAPLAVNSAGMLLRASAAKKSQKTSIASREHADLARHAYAWEAKAWHPEAE